MDELKEINTLMNYFWKHIKDNEGISLYDEEAWDRVVKDDGEVIDNISNNETKQWAIKVACATEMLIDARARKRNK